jgi:hypothetical protein
MINSSAGCVHLKDEYHRYSSSASCLALQSQIIFDLEKQLILKSNDAISTAELILR